MTLDDELDRIFATRDRNNMQPSIDALLRRYASHPENARVLYEVGGAYDTDGQEEVARGYYERALAAALEGDLLRRCCVQYGSTLRNVGEYEKSLEAVATLLDLPVDFVRTPDIDRYKPAISGNAAYIRSLDRNGSDI